jgi:winged helix DNA-binding protein
VAEQRLRHQSITGPPRRTVEQVVSWLGAVQAQEYSPAKWALALRMAEGTTQEKIEDAFTAGRILRTHVMRPTWHFVTPGDIRWMLDLTGPRVQRLNQVYNRHLELDARTLNRAVAIIERALAGETYLTRVELAERLARAGIEAKGQRLAQAVMHAELEAVICSGPRKDGKFTYALLAERAPTAQRLPREAALAELAKRFFRSHGPATIRDFVWWSGLLTADAKRGLEMSRARHKVIDNLTYWWIADVDAHPARGHSLHLLPVYDEYFVAYRDRRAVTYQWTPGAASFPHSFVIDGQIGGTWRSTRNAKGLKVEVRPLKTLARTERRALDEAHERYSRFVAEPTALALV